MAPSVIDATSKVCYRWFLVEGHISNHDSHFFPEALSDQSMSPEVIDLKRSEMDYICVQDMC